MSDHVDHTTSKDSATPSRRGQAFVEFALVLPMLLVLLLGIADFGRVFHAGVVAESSARAAAETAALEYLRNPPDPPGVPADDAYYERLHLIAARTVCEEMRILPNTTYSEADGTCATWPAVSVCVHDGGDTRCNGSAPAGFMAGDPSTCTKMTGGWNSASDTQGHTYVEVRLCYQFTTLFNLKFSLPMNTGLSLGDVFLQKQAFFTVADY